MTSTTQLLASPNKPFRGIVLVPLDSIPVVHRKLVVKVVISFANGDECRDEVIAWSMLVIERCLSKPVCKRVDTKSGLQGRENQYNGNKRGKGDIHGARNIISTQLRKYNHPVRRPNPTME